MKMQVGICSQNSLEYLQSLGHKFMLNKLDEALLILPELLNKPEVWSSLIINRRKPYTYRVFTYLPNGLRLCLHRFDSCSTEEAFFHPHPWPGAFKVLSGSYKMKVGYSKDRFTKPDDVVTLILEKNSRYEIINPLTWHSVVPLSEAHTVMVNDNPWDVNTFAHTDVRTTKGKDLDSMLPDELSKHLVTFQNLIKESK